MRKSTRSVRMQRENPNECQLGGILFGTATDRKTSSAPPNFPSDGIFQK